MQMFTTFPWLNITLSSFKQLPLNPTLLLVPQQSKFGVILWLGVSTELIFSSKNPLDCQ